MLISLGLSGIMPYLSFPKTPNRIIAAQPLRVRMGQGQCNTCKKRRDHLGHSLDELFAGLTKTCPGPGPGPGPGLLSKRGNGRMGQRCGVHVGMRVLSFGVIEFG